jgi:uroporphyrin-III C-methyltransferase / precorrin-2 dehydrogenase / sirohydrochlorin ferrochelatase
MNLLPIFLSLEGRPCLLVGAGNVALEKVGSLLRTGARLRVVAPEARPEIRGLHQEGRLEWIERGFEPSDLDGHFVVIAATNQAAVNRAVYRGAVERNIPCNSVDDIPNCDFFFGSVVRRGDLQIAISTSGNSPAVAQRLRREIDEQLPEDLGPWLEALGQLRRDVLEQTGPSETRKRLLHALAERKLCDSASCPSRQLAAHFVSGNSLAGETAKVRAGKVFLVGAGPGDPDLLTLKAHRLIQSAEVILHDDLVTESVLALASAQCEAINVGKRCGVKDITQEQINALMIEHARMGRNVVRLKSGDPLIFGRAAEEIEALGRAGVPFEIVPGITSASAAAAAVGCSLTDRNAASNVIFSTGHHAQSHNQAALPELEDATRAVYMPGRDLSLLAREWLEEGLPADFPCAVISHASQPSQRVQSTTLGSLGTIAPSAAPSLLIAGWALRNRKAAQNPEVEALDALAHS